MLFFEFSFKGLPAYSDVLESAVLEALNNPDSLREGHPAWIDNGIILSK